ncbi:hypothetical protein K1T71_015289 [Dendrolimus kikuchii]|nr:hypothetical protein K1T71_015289 [Dendrolimus kikuchii]
MACVQLQAAVTELGEWFRKWRIEVNPEKSAAMFFSPGTLRSPKRACLRLKTISLYEQQIPWEKYTKYLGVTLDRNLRFNEHITIIRNRARFVMGRLAPMIDKRSKMSLRHKLTLYKTCIRPIMTYASVVFGHAKPALLDKLQIVQNKFMRRAVGAPLYMRNVDLHRDLELPSIKNYITSLSRQIPKALAERYAAQAAGGTGASTSAAPMMFMNEFLAQSPPPQPPSPETIAPVAAVLPPLHAPIMPSLPPPPRPFHDVPMSFMFDPTRPPPPITQSSTVNRNLKRTAEYSEAGPSKAQIREDSKVDHCENCVQRKIRIELYRDQHEKLQREYEYYTLAVEFKSKLYESVKDALKAVMSPEMMFVIESCLEESLCTT